MNSFKIISRIYYLKGSLLDSRTRPPITLPESLALSTRTQKLFNLKRNYRCMTSTQRKQEFLAITSEDSGASPRLHMLFKLVRVVLNTVFVINIRPW